MQGSNLGLLHCRQILCHLRHQGSPSIIHVLWHLKGCYGFPILFRFVIVSIVRHSFINFCLDNTDKVSMVYSNTHSSFILSLVDELQMLCSRSIDTSSFTHPGRKGTATWSVVFLLQMRVAKSLILSKRPHDVCHAYLHITYSKQVTSPNTTSMRWESIDPAWGRWIFTSQ